MQIVPSSDVIGAEIQKVGLAQPLSAAEFLATSSSTGSNQREGVITGRREGVFYYHTLRLCAAS